MKKYLNKFSFWWQSGLLAVLTFAPAAVRAVNGLTADEKTRCDNFRKQFQGMFANLPDQYCSINALLLSVLQMALVLAGTIAVLFIVLGGFWFLTSAGNDEQAEKGQKTLTNAIIGLVVIILAGTIVRIVANSITLGN